MGSFVLSFKTTLFSTKLYFSQVSSCFFNQSQDFHDITGFVDFSQTSVYALFRPLHPAFSLMPQDSQTRAHHVSPIVGASAHGSRMPAKTKKLALIRARQGFLTAALFPETQIAISLCFMMSFAHLNCRSAPLTVTD
jgi:hypothetical protein